jgi:hypothetical protein
MNDENLTSLTKTIAKITSNIQMSIPRIDMPKIDLPIIDSSLARTIEAINESMRSISSSGWLNNYYEQAKVLTSITSRITSSPAFQVMSEPEFKLFKKEYGWCFSLMPVVAYPLYLKYKEGLNGGLDTIWDTFNDPDFVEDALMGCRASLLVADRMPLIEKAIEHHSKGDYPSAVCLLLPQLDGLIWDIGTLLRQVENVPLSRNKIDSSGNLIIKNKYPVRWDIGRLSMEIWAAERPGVKSFGEKFKEDIYSDEFRHVVLHGRDMSRCTKANSALLILALMVISAEALNVELSFFR